MNYRYPLVMGIVLLTVIFPNTDLFSQCAYDCKTNVSIEIPESGSYTLLPQDLMEADPEGCVPFDRLFITPATVNCADLGETISYEIRVEGTNFLLCTGSISVSPAVTPTVYARDSVTLALSEDQSKIDLLPSIFIDSISGNGCTSGGDLLVEPAFVDCADVGRPVNYLLRWRGTQEIAARGTLFLLDPTPPQLAVVDTFYLFLEPNAGTVRVRPELAVIALNDNCLRFGDIGISPSFVDCTDANRDQAFILLDEVRGDTLGTGVLAVRDTFSKALQCYDTLRVEMPNNGFPTFLSPDLVIQDFADNCIDPNAMYVNPPVLDCKAVGTYTDYQLRLRENDEQLCAGIIELKDNTLPELSCVGDSIIEIPSGTDTLTLGIDDLLSSFRDNCLDQEDLLISGQLAFTCASVGQSFDYVIYTPDSIPLCGGKISVRDLREKDIFCPQQVTVHLPLDSGYVRTSLTSFLTGYDSLSCATQSDLVLSPATIDCGDVGAQLPFTVSSLTRGDTLCAGVVSVADTSAPQMTCQDTLVVYQLEDGTTIPLEATDVVTNFSDNCLSVNDARLSVVSIPCFLGSVSIDYEVSVPGYSSFCSGVIQVLDTFDIIPDCVDTLRRVLPADGSPLRLQPADALDRFSDNCYDLSDLYITPNDLDCAVVGDSNLFYTVRVGTTNETVCTGVLDIVDQSIPTVACRDTLRLTLGASGASPAPEIGDVLLSFEDNCGDPSQLSMVVADSFTCQDQATPQSYALKLSDGQTICSGVIVVGDQTAPTITCRQEVRALYLPRESDAISLSPELFVTSFGDNCASPASLDIIPKMVDCSMTDDTMGYVIRYVFTGEVLCQGQFVVRDTFLPEPLCRDTVVYNLPAFNDNSRLGVEDVILTTNDNCSSFTDYSLDLAEPNCEDVGAYLPYNLIYLPTGDTLCSGVVQVVDNVPTTIVCKSQVDFVIPQGDLPPVIFPETVLSEFSDNCLRISDLMLEPMNYSCAQVGQPMAYTLMIRETEQTLCTGTITFVERTAPIVDCKESVSIQLTEAGDPKSITPGEVITSIKEDCTPIFDLTASISPSVVDCSDAGLMLPYTVTVTDASGNRGRCNGVITVLDDMDPVALCKDSVSVTLSKDGFDFPNPRILDDGSFDNCDNSSQLNYRMSPSLFNCEDVGQTFATTLTVRDQAGNESTCTTQLSVEGQPDPMTVRIIAPESVACNSVAVYRANVEHAGFFVRYRWTIEEGGDRGWRILSSRSGQSVNVSTGTGSVKLKVEVENIGGCAANDTIENTCQVDIGGVIVTSLQDPHNEQEYPSVVLFPNPARDQLNVKLEAWSGEVRYRIYNVQGMVVRQIAPHYVNEADRIDLSDLPAGRYVLSLEPFGHSPVRTSFIIIE